MRRVTTFSLVGTLPAFLLLSVAAQAWLLPAEVRRIAAVFPEVEPIAVPAVIWGVMAIACWQVAAVIGLRLASPLSHGTFAPAWYGWLRWMVGCLLAFIVLVVAAFIALNLMGYATPGVMLGLMGSGFVAVVAAGSLVLCLAGRPRSYGQAAAGPDVAGH